MRKRRSTAAAALERAGTIAAGRAHPRRERPVEKLQVNPWSWQDRFGFSQAWRVDGAQTVVFLSGQGPISADGELVADDFETQARQTFENLRTVLEAAG